MNGYMNVLMNEPMWTKNECPVSIYWKKYYHHYRSTCEVIIMKVYKEYREVHYKNERIYVWSDDMNMVQWANKLSFLP